MGAAERACSEGRSINPKIKEPGFSKGNGKGKDQTAKGSEKGKEKGSNKGKEQKWQVTGH